MAPLKQKETVILFNAFLLEATPFPPTTTIDGTIHKSLKRQFIMACLLFTTINTLASFYRAVLYEPTLALWVSGVNQAHKRRV